MPGLPFTLRQLEIFELLCKLRSFRLVGDELRISQASVSNQLKALENQLGTRLLSREPGKRPLLTKEGAAFLADLGDFWRAAEQLATHRRAGNTPPPAELRLRVMIGNYILKDCVRPKLDGFVEAHPSIHLDFVSPTISDLPGQVVERDHYDLALFQEQLARPLGPGMRELARIRCGVFGHRSFLKGKNRLLTTEEISALPFVLPPAGTPYENLVLSLLAQAGIKPQTVAGRTQYFDVMSAMFERGNCVGATLEPILRNEHRNVALLYPLEDWRLVYYRNPQRNEPQLQAVEDFLISSVLDDPSYPTLPRPAAGGRRSMAKLLGD